MNTTSHISPVDAAAMHHICKSDRVQICQTIRDEPRVSKDCASALAGATGTADEWKDWSYNPIRGGSYLVTFDRPIQHWSDRALLVAAFWVPARFVLAYTPAAPFKHYNGKPEPYMDDGCLYVNLDEGDIIAPGDYIRDGAQGWNLATDGFGAPVPNPCFSSHRQYRRRAI